MTQITHSIDAQGQPWAHEHASASGSQTLGINSPIEITCPICRTLATEIAWEQDMKWCLDGVLGRAEPDGEARITLTPCGHVVPHVEMRLRRDA